MAERIELPPTLSGEEKAQLQQLWSYLYQTAEKLNINLEGIGGNDLTDSEKAVMERLVKTTAEQAGAPGDMAEAITLKSLIIKTADTVASSLQEIRKNLVAETVAEGRFGRYVRNTSQEVEVTPDHDKRTFTFSELIQGLKTYEVNAKNYIKTGLLRMNGLIPVYGVAIGQDVVTFAEDGTETYNDGNKVAELTADELSFWQSGEKIASYTGGKISFLYNGTESFYIQNGKIFCTQDLELTGGKKIVLNNWTLSEDGMNYDNKQTGSGKRELAIENNYYGDKLVFFYQTGEAYGAMEFYGQVPKYHMVDPGRTEGCLDVPIGKILESYISDLETAYIHFCMDTSKATADIYSDTSKSLKLHMESTDPNAAQSGDINFSLGMYTLYFGTPGTYLPGIDSDLLNCKEIIASHVGYGTLHQMSSREIKHDIKDLPDPGKMLDALRPVSFVYNNDEEGRKRFGLIHEETVGILPEICAGKAEDPPERKAISYVDLIPLLLKEIQGLRARVAALEAKVNGEGQ